MLSQASRSKPPSFLPSSAVARPPEALWRVQHLGVTTNKTHIGSSAIVGIANFIRSTCGPLCNGTHRCLQSLLRSKATRVVSSVRRSTARTRTAPSVSARRERTPGSTWQLAMRRGHATPSRCSCAPSEPSRQPDRVGSAPTLPQRGPHRACSYDAADSKLFANRPGEHGEIRATAMALQVCHRRRGVAGDPMVPCDGQHS